MESVQDIKRRFGVIGNTPALDRAVEIAVRVAPTDLTVFVSGESGTGKEVFPKIIHAHSHRKHKKYIAVNCGAIPEGTIDSELFGHKKGSFTGALSDRKGYFEVADGGTLFLDEVGELPLSTQVRLLRVLEAGEFIRVGSSDVQRVDVRVVAATNINLPRSIADGKFREDLFYRLNTVPIKMIPLRARGSDVSLLFRKFASDFADKYHMPPVRLTAGGRKSLEGYGWPGNVRQLKNITEQISVIETERLIDEEKINGYLLIDEHSNLPALISGEGVDQEQFNNEREVLYKILFDMKREVNELRGIVNDIVGSGYDVSRSASNSRSTANANSVVPSQDNFPVVQSFVQNESDASRVNITHDITEPDGDNGHDHDHDITEVEEIIEESLSLELKEKEMIQKALDKHRGKRKYAAEELGISERTLYRKIKEYDI